MMRQIIGKNVKEMTEVEFSKLASQYDHIVVDLGTGDGKFSYNLAKNNPHTLVIGIDASREGMEDVSHKASRKPPKGGLPNVIFVWAAAEQLPDELAASSHEIYINFPWGSLLAGVVKGEQVVMEGIAKIAHTQAKIHIFVSYDSKYEPQIMQQLELPVLSLDYINNALWGKYQKFDLAIVDAFILTAEQKELLTSSWPKKILSQRDRDIYYFLCRPTDYSYDENELVPEEQRAGAALLD